jgi:hypothetical protein
MCLLHVETAAASAEGSPRDDDYDEPYVFGQLQLSVDRLGPFSLREYVKLLLLRSRVQEERSSCGPLVPMIHTVPSR